MQEETASELFNHIPVPSLIVGLVDSVILDANKAACRFYHISREELVGTQYCSLCADKNDFQSEMKVTILDKINNSYKCVHKTRTGHIRDVIVHSECLRYHDQDASCLIIIDITERAKQTKYLHMFNKCLLEFSESPEGNIQSLTKLCGSLLGGTAALYSRIDNGQLCAVGAWNVPEDFNRVTSPEGHICHDVITGSDTKITYIEDLRKTHYFLTDSNVAHYGLATYYGVQIQLSSKHNGSLCVLFNHIFHPEKSDREILEVIGSAIGIEERRWKAENTLTSMAYSDALTGIPNRALFFDRLQHEISICERSKSRFAVFFVDIDNLKRINDTHGHSAGDRILQTAAKRLSVCVRSEDTLARMSGDEFTIIFRETAGLETAENLAKRITECMNQPVEWGGDNLTTGASVGIALYPKDGADAQTLLRNADKAMYQAKVKGRKTYCFFDASFPAEF